MVLPRQLDNLFQELRLEDALCVFARKEGMVGRSYHKMPRHGSNQYRNSVHLVRTQGKTILGNRLKRLTTARSIRTNAYHWPLHLRYVLLNLVAGDG